MEAATPRDGYKCVSTVSGARCPQLHGVLMRQEWSAISWASSVNVSDNTSITGVGISIFTDTLVLASFVSHTYYEGTYTILTLYCYFYDLLIISNFHKIYN